MEIEQGQMDAMSAGMDALRQIIAEDRFELDPGGGRLSMRATLAESAAIERAVGALQTLFGLTAPAALTRLAQLLTAQREGARNGATALCPCCLKSS